MVCVKKLVLCIASVSENVSMLLKKCTCYFASTYVDIKLACTQINCHSLAIFSSLVAVVVIKTESAVSTYVTEANLSFSMHLFVTYVPKCKICLLIGE